MLRTVKKAAARCVIAVLDTIDSAASGPPVPEVTVSPEEAADTIRLWAGPAPDGPITPGENCEHARALATFTVRSNIGLRTGASAAYLEYLAKVGTAAGTLCRETCGTA